MRAGCCGYLEAPVRVPGCDVLRRPLVGVRRRSWPVRTGPCGGRSAAVNACALCAAESVVQKDRLEPFKAPFHFYVAVTKNW